MKKVILLIDTGNCKFLIVKSRKYWNLPTLENVKNIIEVEKLFFNKYSINIYKVEIIEEKNNYIVIKALTRDELDSEIYMSDIINNIILLIQNKQQKNVLFTISKKIFLEIANDSF